MSRDLVLALDLGTTSVRALVVAADGAVRARAQRPLETAYPAPGRVEQDPAELFSGSVEVLRGALGAARLPAADVAGLGVVTQRSTAIAWDAQSGEPLAPAIGWQDTRTAERVAGFRAAGIPLNTLASATKFEWLLANDPAVRKAADAGTLRLGTPDAWLTAALTGFTAHVTDPGNASCTALFDAAQGEWAQPLLDLFGVPRECLPSPIPTSGVVGETPPALLGAGVRVAARAGDQQAAAFGQGVHAAGDAKLTLGTSAMLDVHTGGALGAPSSGSYPLALWQLPDDGRAFCQEGTVITAGAAVDWLVALGVARDAAELDALARTTPSSAGVVFVPAFQGLGTPWLDDAATGFVSGLTRGAGRGELARALLEGVAQRCVDVMEALELSEAPLPVDGGLAQSGFLLQSLADLSGRALHRAAETETTALGAAYLAGLCCGVWPDPESCRATLAEPTVFEPAADPTERAEARARWRRAIERTRSGEA